MCSEPVTFGGGMTMENGGLSLVGVRREVDRPLPSARTAAALPRPAGTGRKAPVGRLSGVRVSVHSVTRQVYGARRGSARMRRHSGWATVAAMSDSTASVAQAPRRRSDARADRASPDDATRPSRSRSIGGPFRLRPIRTHDGAAADRSPRAGPGGHRAERPARGGRRRRRRAGRPRLADLRRRRTPTLTMPAQVAGAGARRQRRRAKATADYLRTALRRRASTWTRAVGAVYTDPAAADRSVLLFGGTTLLWSPERDLDTAVRARSPDDQRRGRPACTRCPPATWAASMKCGTTPRRRRHGDRRCAAGPTTAAVATGACFPGRSQDDAAHHDPREHAATPCSDPQRTHRKRRRRAGMLEHS